jgi:hypothetical protein
LKRSEALQSLSRDHHQALVLAQRLQRSDDPGEAAAEFLEFWKTEGALHFRVEEEVLMPVWALLGTVQTEAAERLAAEHLRIRAAAMALAAEAPSLADVRELGTQLAAHVRFEERELFELIEQDLGASELEFLAQAVTDAEHRS